MMSVNGKCITLSALLALLKPADHVFLIHRIGPHECEAVGGGTVREMRETPCVEVCGECEVEDLALDTEDLPGWVDEEMPVLVITIKRGAAK